MALWKKILLKSDRNFDSAPVNVIFEHVPCRFVISQRIVPQDLLCIFFFKFNPEVLLSTTMLSMRIWSSQGKFCLREHVPIRGSIFDVDCHAVSDVSLCIIVTLAWFWLCKMWLFPWFVKYVIEIHVAKVALGILHLNFLQLAPGRSTSFKLVDHSPAHNTSTQRARSYILISLNVHWRISEHMHRLISSDDAWTHPAWRNWLVFPDAYTLYYTYILVRLVLASTVLLSFSPSLFFRFSCLIFFSCWTFSRLHFRGKGF